MNPTLAVITPTKNRLKLLCEAMDSVQHQSLDSWEHIIVDDGSNDGTSQEVTRRAKLDPRIRYIQRTGDKAGANVCRNIGVNQSQAEFIVFLDSDDLLEPECLRRRVDVMRRNADLDFATFQTSLFVEKQNDLGRVLNPELLGDDLLSFLYFELPWIITAPIWRRSSLVKLGLFDESLLSWQDVDLHLRALASHVKYLRWAEVDHHVRWHSDPAKTSLQQRRSPQHLQESERILEKFENVVRANAGINWVRQRALCGLYFFLAECWIEKRDLSRAFRTWKIIRTRTIGNRVLWVSGAVLLLLERFFRSVSLVPRLVGKWKGWVRFRTNPALLKASS